jgi:CelD/BcsL family acetyltransferase involved in cellulose biosynthesis
MSGDRDWQKSSNGGLTREPATPVQLAGVVRQATPPRTMDIEPVDRSRWTELAHGFADHNYRQCWDFGIQAASHVGAKSEHLALRQAGEVVAIADVRVRELPVLGGGLAFVTGGPLTRNDRHFDPARYVDAVEALRRRYVDERGCVLRILAPVGPPEWNDALNAVLAKGGFESTDAASPYRTLLLPVGCDLAEIRRRFHQKWRNQLNRAEREHIEVRVGSDTEFLDRFAALFEEFVVRKGFDVFYGADFYQRLQRELPEQERYVVLLAEREGQLLSGAVTSMLGDTCVLLLAATSPEGLKCKASYLIQWRTIELARERGCVNYDQGLINPEGNPGVYHFKVGLAGTDVRAAGPLQAVGGVRGKMTLTLEAWIRAAELTGAARLVRRAHRRAWQALRAQAGAG